MRPLVILALAVGSLALTGAENSVIGTWRVTTVIQPDGTTLTPSDMYLAFSEAGDLTATVGSLGSTVSHYRIAENRRHRLVLQVEAEGTRSQALVEFNEQGTSISSNGTTMFLHHLDAAELAARTEAVRRQPAAALAPEPPLTAPVAGMVAGAAWKLVDIQPNLLQDTDGWHVVLRAEPPTDPASERLPQILVTVPKVVGRRPLSNAFNLTFYTPPATNRACATGMLEVLSITETAVTCSVRARLDDATHLAGIFTFDPRRIPPP